MEKDNKDQENNRHQISILLEKPLAGAPEWIVMPHGNISLADYLKSCSEIYHADFIRAFEKALELWSDWVRGIVLSYVTLTKYITACTLEGRNPNIEISDHQWKNVKAIPNLFLYNSSDSKVWDVNYEIEQCFIRFFQNKLTDFDKVFFNLLFQKNPAFYNIVVELTNKIKYCEVSQAENINPQSGWKSTWLVSKVLWAYQEAFLDQDNKETQNLGVLIPLIWSERRRNMDNEVNKSWWLRWAVIRILSSSDILRHRLFEGKEDSPNSTNQHKYIARILVQLWLQWKGSVNDLLKALGEDQEQIDIWLKQIQDQSRFTTWASDYGGYLPIIGWTRWSGRRFEN